MNNFYQSTDSFQEEDEANMGSDYPESYTEEASPYEDSSNYESLLQLKETLEQTGELFNGSLGELNDEEQEQLYSEILPALLPIITSVAPAVIQGVSSLIAKRRQRQAAQRRPPQVRKAPARQVSQKRPPARHVVQRTTQSTAPRIPAGISQLLSLVSNPQVINLLKRAASGNLREGILVPNEQVIVPFRSIINAIHEFSAESLEELSREQITENPSYLLNAEGEFRCDPENTMERAEIVQQLLSKL